MGLKIPTFAFLLGSTGCSDQFLQLPDFSESIQTIIFIGVSEGAPTFVVKEPSGGLRAELVADEIYAAAYEYSLERLGLVEGVATELSSPSCLLYRPARVLRAEPGGSFAEVSPDAARHWLVPDGDTRCRACKGFEEIRVPLDLSGPGSASISLGGPFSDGSVFVGETASALFRVDRSAATRLSCDNHYTNATQNGPDTFWMSGDGSLTIDLVSFDLGTNECRIVTSRQVPAGFGKIEALTSDPMGADELYAVTSSGALFRVREAQSDDWGQLSLKPNRRKASIARMGPESVAFSAGGNDVSLVQAGNVQTFEAVSETYVSALSMIDGVGLMMGSTEGKIYRYTSLAFELVRTLRVSAVGRIFGTPTGYGASSFGSIFVTESGEDCEPHAINPPSNQSPEEIWAGRDGAIFVGDILEDPPVATIWLTPL